jgi:hypothetical protein
MAGVELSEPDDPFAFFRKAPGDASQGVGLGDYGRAVVAGAYDVAGQLAGAGEYLTGNTNPEGVFEQVKGWANRGSTAQHEAMSPVARRAMVAKVLPGDGETMWDKDVSTSHAIGLNVAGAVPSLLASIIPGGLVARAALAAGAGVGAAGAVGAAAGYGVSGGMTAGDTYNDIKKSLEDTPADKLYATNEVYRGLVNMGVSPDEARGRVLDYVEGYKPVLMGAITAFTSKLFGGVEGRVATKVASRGAGAGAIAGEKAAGRIGSTVGGAAGEAGQEFSENLAQDILQQKGAKDIADKSDPNYNLHQAFEAAIKNAMIGAASGGAVGLGTGGHGHAPANAPRDATADIAPDVAAALTPQGEPAPPTVPAPVTPAAPGVTPPLTVDQKLAPVGHELDTLQGVAQDAGVGSGVLHHVDTATTVQPTGLDIGPDEAQALGYFHDPELGEHPDAGLTGETVPEPPAPQPVAQGTPQDIPAPPHVPMVASPLAEAIGAEPATAPAPVAAPEPAVAPQSLFRKQRQRYPPQPP